MTTPTVDPCTCVARRIRPEHCQDACALPITLPAAAPTTGSATQPPTVEPSPSAAAVGGATYAPLTLRYTSRTCEWCGGTGVRGVGHNWAECGACDETGFEIVESGDGESVPTLEQLAERTRQLCVELAQSSRLPMHMRVADAREELARFAFYGRLHAEAAERRS